MQVSRRWRQAIGRTSMSEDQDPRSEKGRISPLPGPEAGWDLPEVPRLPGGMGPLYLEMLGRCGSSSKSAAGRVSRPRLRRTSRSVMSADERSSSHWTLMCRSVHDESRSYWSNSGARGGVGKHHSVCWAERGGPRGRRRWPAGSAHCGLARWRRPPSGRQSRGMEFSG